MGSRPEPDFAGFLGRLTRSFDAARIPFMLIGGQAVLLHGIPRLTEDVDATLAVTPDHIERVLAACRDAGLVPLPDNPAAFARDTFVLPARDPDVGIRADLIFSSTPYEHAAIARAISVDVAGVQVPFATAEDLIVHKLFANRPRDWEDAVGVARRRTNLDWSYVRRWADEFAQVPGREQMPALVDRLRSETTS